MLVLWLNGLGRFADRTGIVGEFAWATSLVGSTGAPLRKTVRVFAAELAERDVPDFVQVDHKEMKGTYLRAPAMGDVPYPVQMEPNLVIEFYSR